VSSIAASFWKVRPASPPPPACRPGTVFRTDGAGADPELQAREGRQAARAALEPLRAGRHRRLHGQRQEVHREDRRRSARGQRRLGRRAAEGRRGRQHRRRPGHHPVDQRRRQPVPREAAGRDRPGRIPRQEVRRLVPGRAPVPAPRRQEVAGPGPGRRRLDDRVPREHGEGRGLQPSPRTPPASWRCTRRSRKRARPAAMRWATPPATASGPTG
jgi:hypothetical protein